MESVKQTVKKADKETDSKTVKKATTITQINANGRQNGFLSAAAANTAPHCCAAANLTNPTNLTQNSTANDGKSAFESTGDNYYYGKGVPVDFAKAAASYERAHPLNSHILMNLADCYERCNAAGKGAEQAAALRERAKAAANGLNRWI